MASQETKTILVTSESPAAVEYDGVHDEDHDIDRFGYKPELQRRFGLWSMIGLSCMIMVTWEGWLAVANVSLINGGKAGTFYGFLFTWFGYAAVVASLSELISMIPTAGGQYHWTWELAPAKYRKFISWITGWQIVLAWQADMAAVFYLVGTIIQGLAILNYPDYAFQRWHGTMIIWALVIVATLINTFMVKILPWIEGGILVAHIVGFVLIVTPILYYAPHASAREVFTDFQSLGGYNNGTSWFVGLISTVFAFLGADGAIHMAEEVRNSRVNVPRALMSSVTVNGVLGIGMILVAGFTIGDLTTALETNTGFVFIDYFARALGSDAFATGLVSFLLVMFVFACVAILASTSRITWAFARDNGLPGSFWLKKVSPTLQLPVISILFTGLVSFLLSFINIGSAVAFNAIVSLVVASFFGSYMIPIAIVAWMRITRAPLELGPWNLGRFGLAINIISLVWLAITWIFSFFPVAIPVTPETMNWSCVLWGSLMLFGVIWYHFVQRHVFTGPNVIVGSMNIQ